MAAITSTRMYACMFVCVCVNGYLGMHDRDRANDLLPRFQYLHGVATPRRRQAGRVTVHLSC